MVSDFLKKDLGNLSSFFTVRDILPLQKKWRDSIAAFSQKLCTINKLNRPLLKVIDLNKS